MSSQRSIQSILSLRNIAILVGFGVLGFGTLRLLSFRAMSPASAQNSTQNSTASPNPSSEATRVLALGHLEPEGEMLRLAGPMGARIRELKVEEGATVQAGQVLAYLDTYPEMLAKRDLAASQVEEQRNQLSSSTALGQVEVRLAQSQQEQIEAPKTKELQSQTSAIRQAEAALQQAIVMRDRYDSLYHEGAVPREDLEIRQLTVVQLQEKLIQEQNKLAQLSSVSGADRQTAERTIERSQANLAQVDSHSGLESAEQNLKLAEAQLDQTIIRAPRAGQVLKIMTHEGEAITSDGILALGNTQRMIAVAEVYETDIGRVKVGQPASVTSPAFSEPIRGTVAQIGRTVFKNNIVGDDPSARSDARVVEVKVQLEPNPQIAGLSNLQVDVQIDLN